MLAGQTNTTAIACERDPIDAHVGARLRQRRNLVGLSQEQLARHLGVTFQQIQKYERAANRISASKLFRLARILDVPVGWFYEELSPDPFSGHDAARNTPGLDMDGHIFNRRETLELVRAYYRLRKEHRRRFYDLLKSTAGRDRGAS